MIEADSRGVPESLLEEEQANSPEFDDVTKILSFCNLCNCEKAEPCASLLPQPDPMRDDVQEPGCLRLEVEMG